MEKESMSEEWGMVDYYCYDDCNGIEEEGETRSDDEKWCSSSSSRIGWVMEAGKKLVMAGVVISSAPVVLPPLLVVSALGFAVSLPFGVVFATYACTHKLMTKLLPPPPPPLPPYEDEDEDDGGIKVDEDEIRKQEDEEEEKMSEEGTEMRIEEIEEGESGGEKNVTKAKLEEGRNIDEESSNSSENENINIDVEESIFHEEIRPSEKIEQEVILMKDDDVAISEDKHKDAAQLPADVMLPDDHEHRGEDEGLSVLINGDLLQSDKELELSNGGDEKE